MALLMKKYILLIFKNDGSFSSAVITNFYYETCLIQSDMVSKTIVNILKDLVPKVIVLVGKCMPETNSL